MPLKVVIINKSDSLGGAAVVSFRLMNALNTAGVDARMLVCEKRHSSPFIELAASRMSIRKAFIAERLKVFAALGFRRENLFKVDTATDGLPLWRHRWVREADIVCLNWVNQGMLSLYGVEKIYRLGKPVVWTMHDMWNMTGVCHHAGTCEHFRRECGDCPLLGSRASASDISHATWQRKRRLNERHKIHYVAVSRWLAGRAADSSLLGDADISVIPNAFPVPVFDESGRPERPPKTVRLVFGAARIDDPIKGLPVLLETTRILAERQTPERRYELVVYGGMKDPHCLDGAAIPVRQLGFISSAIRKIYARGDIVISTSHYETLPGTLVEGQAFGCIPVAFDHGGQSDIIDDGLTGCLVEYSADVKTAARNMADGISRAADMIGPEIRRRMYGSVSSRFSEEAVTAAYIRLFDRLKVK